jgi:mono/diheme cytochrome c family protein
VKAKVVKTEVVDSTIVATDLVAVPVAVSVGVPVAQAAPYYYTYSAYSTPSATAGVDLDALAIKIVEKLRAVAPPAQRGQQPAPPPVPVTHGPATIQQIGRSAWVAERCATCHSGPAPKGQLSLENLPALDSVTRLKAIRAVLSEKMPKGGPRLTPEQAGQILEELVGQ